MKEIDLLDAKKQLSIIVEHIKRTGQGITITKCGEPYVDLLPHRAAVQSHGLKSRVLKQMNELRLELPKSNWADIKADINACNFDNE